MEQFLRPGQWDKDPEQYYDNPLPEITFIGETFVLTGIFALGDRSAVEAQIESVGGTVARVPPKVGCTVVVGTLPSHGWVQNSAGRKLLTALKMREEGHPIRIVGEDYFVNALITVQNDPNYKPPQKEPGFPWDEMLAAWLAPLREDGVTYEYSISKAMVSVHMPEKPKERLCTIRFNQYEPTSIDIPGIRNDQLPFCWENGEHCFNAVAEKRLSQDVLRALREKVKQYR